jgi:hypothetical protein
MDVECLEAEREQHVEDHGGSREYRYCDASAALEEELRTAYEKRVMWGGG